MLHTKTSVEKESLYAWLVMLARRHDIVALVTVKGLFKIVYSARMNVEDLAALRDYEVLHLITLGKTTKSKLTAAEQAELLVYIKECNIRLN